MRLVPEAGTGSAEVCGYWTSEFLAKSAAKRRQEGKRARDETQSFQGSPDDGMGHGIRGL